MRTLRKKKYLRTAKGLIYNTLRGDSVYPFYASFKITSKCHFGCPFCNVWKDRTPDLPTSEIIKVLDNLSRSSVLMTSFEGGEPLLREDIGELLKYARGCDFYLLFTTSAKNLLEYPLDRYARYIDFFHVSIDEGHNNLQMFDFLPELAKLPTQVSVQTVVTKETVQSLEEKVGRCYRAGANIVVIPATAMNNARDCFPDIGELEKTLLTLRKRYPDTIHTPQGYFKAYRRARCSSASIVISPDGFLYYPCHILETKGPDMRSVDLTAWLRTKEAAKMRETMSACTRNCGWYQYYSIDSYLAVSTAWESIRPMIFQKKKILSSDNK